MAKVVMMETSMRALVINDSVTEKVVYSMRYEQKAQNFKDIVMVKAFVSI